MNKPNAFAQQLIQGDAAIRENYGIEVLSADAGHSALTLVVTDAWVNGAGFTHGSVA